MIPITPQPPSRDRFFSSDRPLTKLLRDFVMDSAIIEDKIFEFMIKDPIVHGAALYRSFPADAAAV